MKTTWYGGSYKHRYTGGHGQAAGSGYHKPFGQSRYRYSGGHGYSHRWPWLYAGAAAPVPTPSPIVAWAQSCLGQLLGPGVPQSGFIDVGTRQAIQQFQVQQQLPPTGVLDSNTVNALQVACGSQPLAPDGGFDSAAPAGPASPPPPPGEDGESEEEAASIVSALQSGMVKFNQGADIQEAVRRGRVWVRQGDRIILLGVPSFNR